MLKKNYQKIISQVLKKLSHNIRSSYGKINKDTMSDHEIQSINAPYTRIPCEIVKYNIIS